MPGAQRAARTLSQALVELTFPLSAHYHRPLGLGTLFEGKAKEYIREQVHDPVLQDKLTPRYGLGCEAPELHNTYLSTFNCENVQLETDAIEAITPAGVITAGGTEHRARRARPRDRLQGLRLGQLPEIPDHRPRRPRPSRSSGGSTASRPTRASASPASPTTSWSWGPTATTAPPISTSSRPRAATSPAAEPRRAGRRDLGRDHRRRRRPLLRRDDATPKAPDLLAGELRARRTPITSTTTATSRCGPCRRSRRCGEPAAFRSPTTASVGAVRFPLTDHGSPSDRRQAFARGCRSSCSNPPRATAAPPRRAARCG